MIDYINEILNTGNYPDIFKVVNIMPIYKGDKNTDLNSYRPISLLSIFIKIVYNNIFSTKKCIV